MLYFVFSVFYTIFALSFHIIIYIKKLVRWSRRCPLPKSWPSIWRTTSWRAANTFDDVQAHYEAGSDYIGCGPFRFTTTKEKLSPILGLEGYRSIVQQMKAEGIHLPIVAIGGITLEDIPAIMQTGVTGIALSGTILRAANPVEETKKIVSQLKMNNE